MKNELESLAFAAGKLFIAENYPEAVGIMTALRTGVALSSVRRPLAETKVSCERVRGSVEAGKKGEVRSEKGEVRSKRRDLFCDLLKSSKNGSSVAKPK